MLTRIFHIAFAAFLLVITLGVSINQHYCSGNLKEASFWAAFECKHAKALPSLKGSCCLKDKKQPVEKPCCENEEHFAQFDQEYLFGLQHTLPVVADMDLLHSSDVSFVQWPSHQELPKELCRYRPPPNGRDIRIRVQSFLI